jgi:hypothetical protein
VCSLASFVVCPVVLAIVALVLASGASRKIAESGGRLTGESMVSAAKWVAWINIALYGLIVVFVVIVIIVGAVSSSSSGDGFSVANLLSA